MAIEQIVTIVNEFFKAHFLEAAAQYNNGFVASQQGDALMVGGTGGGAGAAWVDLTVRLGPVVKTVRIGENTPFELRRLSDVVLRIAGSNAREPR